MDDAAFGRSLVGRGLSATEVATRVAAGQVNAVDEHTSRSVVQIVRANVFTRFNAILGTLAVLVLATGSWKDATFGLLMIANALIGIVQEVRAKRTLDSLAVLNAPSAHVRRDGVTIELPVEQIVLGDTIELRAGDQVPADGAVIDTHELEVDESLLTGESDPVLKAVDDEVRSGSIVVAGRGLVTTTAVGADSYARRIAADARRFTVTKSELVAGINTLLTYISWALVVVGPILFWSELRSNSNWRTAVTGATAGLVGMVPEGLVLLTTFAFLVASLTLARQQVLVQELPAVEGLARVDVVCLDKTGTLTEGDIEFTAFEPVGDPARDGDIDGDIDIGIGGGIQSVLGALADDPNPNGTLVALARSFTAPAGWTRTGSVAFSGARKWSGVTFADHGTWVLGAPEIVLDRAKAPHAAGMVDGVDSTGSIRRRVDELASSGQRVLVLARAPDPLHGGGDQLPEVTPVALLMFDERVRPDAAETLRYFGEQGVALKVISGDNPRTVAAVAARVGLPGASRSFDARELPDDPEQLADVLESHDVFGRVTPQQKRAMVRALQSRGHVVAMTGDGVNDALALKDADIGVAMGSGAAATRAVAQLVLIDDQFAHLPRVVAEGRRVIANIERVASLFVVKNIYSLVLSLAVAIARVPFPFLPRHLTIISSLTIGIPAFVLALTPNTTRYRPGFLSRVLRFSVPAGVLTAAGVFLSYRVARTLQVPSDQARTAACITTVVIGLWIVVLLAHPLARWKIGLVAAMAGLFVLAIVIPPARTFFALAVPLKALGESVAIGAGTAAAIGASRRLALTWRARTGATIG